MKNRLKGFAFVLTTVVSSLTAQNVVVNGPDGKLQVTVSCSEGGEASYSLVYNGKQMLESSPLGLETNLHVTAINGTITSDTLEILLIPPMITSPTQIVTIIPATTTLIE